MSDRAQGGTQWGGPRDPWGRVLFGWDSGHQCQEDLGGCTLRQPWVLMGVALRGLWDVSLPEHIPPLYVIWDTLGHSCLAIGFWVPG